MYSAWESPRFNLRQAVSTELLHSSAGQRAR